MASISSALGSVELLGALLTVLLPPLLGAVSGRLGRGSTMRRRLTTIQQEIELANSLDRWPVAQRRVTVLVDDLLWEYLALREKPPGGEGAFLAGALGAIPAAIALFVYDIPVGLYVLMLLGGFLAALLTHGLVERRRKRLHTARVTRPSRPQA